MFELLVALGVVVMLGALVALAAVPPEILLGVGALGGGVVRGALAAPAGVPPETPLGGGALLAPLGLPAGTPASVASPRALGRAVATRPPLPPRWWWRPLALHEKVPPALRPRVMA